MSRHRLLNVRSLLPIVTAIIAIIAVACGSSDTPQAAAPTAVPVAAAAATAVPAPQAQATQAPVVATGGKYGGTVRMSAYADTKDWDPRGSSSLSSIQAVSQLYNQIVQMDTTDTSLVVCDLCDSWEISNNGETFTFNIRD